MLLQKEKCLHVWNGDICLYCSVFVLTENRCWLFWYVWNHLCAFSITEFHIPMLFPELTMEGGRFKHMKINMTFWHAIFLINQQVKWGLDLQSEHERYITEVAFGGRPVIIRDYPKVCFVHFSAFNCSWNELCLPQDIYFQLC